MSNIKCRILCIDDHRDSAEMLCVLLSQEDYEVVVATSIAEAMELINKEPFDLYVLDRRLPDGTGTELCQKLGEACPGVPCIFYTGDAHEVDRQQAMAAGAEGYIAKPHVETLIEMVGTLLSEKECTTAT